MSNTRPTAPSLRSTNSHDNTGFKEEEEDAIREYRIQQKNNRQVQSFRPKSLGWFSVFCVIANRMIGSGIFRTPDTVIKETQSIAGAVLFWALGAATTFAGVFVFVEFGLATPRLSLNGSLDLVSVPSNGGEKNYLEYVYHKPRRLATCIFGIIFICWGNMASNAILFGQSIYIAATGKMPQGAIVRAIALGVATFACFLHIYSRQIGILFNNGFGFVKVLMLLALIIVAIVSFAGKFETKTISGAKDNYVNHAYFIEPSSGSYGYASSFLAILFAYGGFNQANYILGNIKQPRRKFKWEAISAVGTVCVLYIALNICYYGIVPYADLVNPQNSTFVHFIARTLSQTQAARVAAAIQAFSSLGNIIIQTFTAARVKQEIAKEGILPFSRFFAENRNFTFKFWQHRAEREGNGEATPVGALILHWVFNVVLILASFALWNPLDGYRLYVGLYSFAIDALLCFFVGAGLLYLRIGDFFRSRAKWSDISKENRWLSISAAALFTVANLYPIVAIWFQPPRGDPQASKTIVPFWVTGTVGLSTVAMGLLYWVGLEFIYPQISQQALFTEKRHFAHTEAGELVVTNEVCVIAWESK